LVGYTNVGKSTLMTVLSKTPVYAEDKLFATVDSTVRKVVIDNIPFLLSDTVGFIRKLPHHLIESFKSTLDEVTESDILLHVVDVSHPNYLEQIEVVNKTLVDLGVAEKPMIYVYNKLDQLIDYRVKHEKEVTRELITDFYLNKEENSTVYVSAKKSMNIDRLKKFIFEKVKDRHFTIYPNFLKNETY
jgi:GTP-binding protein HflX